MSLYYSSQTPVQLYDVLIRPSECLTPRSIRQLYKKRSQIPICCSKLSIDTKRLLPLNVNIRADMHNNHKPLVMALWQMIQTSSFHPLLRKIFQVT